MKNTHLLTTLLSLFLFCTTLQALSIRNPFRTRNPLLVKENAQPRDIVYVVLELTFEGSGSDNFEVRELKIPLGGMVEADPFTATHLLSARITSIHVTHINSNTSPLPKTLLKKVSPSNNHPLPPQFLKKILNKTTCTVHPQPQPGTKSIFAPASGNSGVGEGELADFKYEDGRVDIREPGSRWYIGGLKVWSLVCMYVDGNDTIASDSSGDGFSNVEGDIFVGDRHAGT